MSGRPGPPPGSAAPDHSPDQADRAYLLAIGALPAGEAAIYQEHLDRCGACQALLDEAAETAAWLADLAPGREGSPDLKAQVMAAARAEADAPAAGDLPPGRARRLRPDAPAGQGAPAGGVPSIAARSEALPEPAGPPGPASADPAAQPQRADLAASFQIRRLRERSGRWPVLALVAALAIALVGLTFWDVRLSGETSRLRQQGALQTAALQAIGAGAAVTPLPPDPRIPGARASLVRGRPGGPSYLILDALPEPPANQVYQAWRLEGSRPVSAGVLPRGAGPAVIELGPDLNATTALALSIEAAPGGRPAPGGPVIWTAPLA